MSKVMEVISLVVNFTGIAFALAFLVINVIFKYDDIKAKNKSFLRVTIIAACVSVVLVMVCCVLGALDLPATSSAYMIMAISWLSTLLLCCVARLLMLVLPRSYSKDTTKAVLKLFSIALVAAIVNMLLSWMFS